MKLAHQDHLFRGPRSNPPKLNKPRHLGDSCHLISSQKARLPTSNATMACRSVLAPHHSERPARLTTWVTGPNTPNGGEWRETRNPWTKMKGIKSYHDIVFAPYHGKYIVIDYTNMNTYTHLIWYVSYHTWENDFSFCTGLLGSHPCWRSKLLRWWNKENNIIASTLSSPSPNEKMKKKHTGHESQRYQMDGLLNA